MSGHGMGGPGMPSIDSLTAAAEDIGSLDLRSPGAARVSSWLHRSTVNLAYHPPADLTVTDDNHAVGLALGDPRRCSANGMA